MPQRFNCFAHTELPREGPRPANSGPYARMTLCPLSYTDGYSILSSHCLLNVLNMQMWRCLTEAAFRVTFMSDDHSGRAIAASHYVYTARAHEHEPLRYKGNQSVFTLLSSYEALLLFYSCFMLGDSRHRVMVGHWNKTLIIIP